MTRRCTLLLLLGACLLFLSGCSDFVDQDQPAVVPELQTTLTPAHPVGQTFVARHDGLDGFAVWLNAAPGTEGQVRLHLREDPQAGEDLATSALPVAGIGAPGFRRFLFAPLAHTEGKYLYAFLDFEGTGALQVGTAAGSAYRDGSLYQDHRPLPDAQLSFRLAYSPARLLLGFAKKAIAGLGLLVVAALLYLLPGWALVAWLWRHAKLAWAERLGLAAAVDLALYALWLLWTDLAGIHLGALNIWLPVGAGVLSLIFLYRGRTAGAWSTVARQWARSSNVWPDLALLGCIGLAFGVRLLVVSSLDAPSWGDSVQHAAITQLLLDNGGLFTSWEPYAAYRSLSVHYGFSVSAAVLSWGTGLSSTTATLLAGQLINGLSALALYPLAFRLSGGKRWAGTGAVLVASLLSPMPAYYVNWGRFAQLAAQAILPGALWFLCDALESRQLRWRAVVLAGATAAGMTLSNYRMPFFYAAFVVAWLIGFGLPAWKLDARAWLPRFGRLALIGLVIVLVILPWRIRPTTGNLETAIVQSVAQASPLNAVLANYQVWRTLEFYVPRGLQILTLAGLVWSLLKRKWTVAAVGLWILGLSLLVAGRLVRLPGVNMIDNFAIVIMLYIPVSLLVGWLIAELVALADTHWRASGHPMLATAAVGVLLLGGWAASRQATIVETRFIMVTRPDMRAMDWIRANTPPPSRFLVEGFRVYGGTSAVGADAGWWIPLLGRRANTMPPQYALVNEIPSEAGYTQRVVGMVAQLEKVSPTSPEGLRLLCEWPVTHVYVGQGQGEVGAGASALFTPEELAGSPSFKLVYHEDRVYIFALDRSYCPSGG